MASSIEVDIDTYRLLTQRNNLDLIVAAASSVTAEIMIDNISSTTGTGRAYKTRGKVHVASSPGSAPVKETGALAGSISVSLGKNSDQSDLIIKSEYALDLEYGTSKMRSRPFIISSLNQALSTRLPEIINRVISYINTNKPSEVKPYLESTIRTSAMTIQEAREIVTGLIDRYSRSRETTSTR